MFMIAGPTAAEGTVAPALPEVRPHLPRPQQLPHGGPPLRVEVAADHHPARVSLGLLGLLAHRVAARPATKALTPSG